MSIIKKATRDNIFVKLLLAGTSGSGKTYGALRVATGMKKEIERKTGKEAKILLLDTEAGRGLYYANEFDYDYVELKERKRSDSDYEDYKKILPRVDEAFAPENYSAIVKYAVDEGYAILLMDSISHEWVGVGGVLQSLKLIVGTNDYVKWRDLTPRHDNFIYTILHSPIHIISTVRSKDDYVIEEGSGGKKTVRKVGLENITRDGLEFEYTAVLKVDNKSHLAEVDKDNTHLFEERQRILSEEDGEKLIDWANSSLATDEQKEKFKVDVQQRKEAISQQKEAPRQPARPMQKPAAQAPTPPPKTTVQPIASTPAPEKPQNPAPIPPVAQPETPPLPSEEDYKLIVNSCYNKLRSFKGKVDPALIQRAASVAPNNELKNIVNIQQAKALEKAVNELEKMIQE